MSSMKWVTCWVWSTPDVKSLVLRLDGWPRRAIFRTEPLSLLLLYFTFSCLISPFCAPRFLWASLLTQLYHISLHQTPMGPSPLQVHPVFKTCTPVSFIRQCAVCYLCRWFHPLRRVGCFTLCCVQGLSVCSNLLWLHRCNVKSYSCVHIECVSFLCNNNLEFLCSSNNLEQSSVYFFLPWVPARALGGKKEEKKI